MHLYTSIDSIEKPVHIIPAPVMAGVLCLFMGMGSEHITRIIPSHHYIAAGQIRRENHWQTSSSF
jgi:hypothetical protein